jgi:hypothetical protein
MYKTLAGTVAGLAAALACAAPALAAPSNVTVRVEGESQTLRPATRVTTDTNPVLVEGAHSCSGTSAGGALFKATGGDVGGEWGTVGFQVLTIKGETHDEPYPADPSHYWSFWVNYEYQNQGLCDAELQEGDDVLMLVDCISSTGKCAPARPLRLSGVPATVAPGQTITVKVDEYRPVDMNTFPVVTTFGTAEGATVAYGGRTATVAADGTAQLTLDGGGPVQISVSKPGAVRTAAVTCVTSGADGNCGTSLPPGTPAGTPDTVQDATAPMPSFLGLREGQVFAHGKGPRRLRGNVTADPSGLRSVRLSIARRTGGRCTTFRGETERFKRHACPGQWYSRIGDRADWSYLLPHRLRKGRYTIGVLAVDKRFNEARTVVHVRVK